MDYFVKFIGKRKRDKREYRVVLKIIQLSFLSIGDNRYRKMKGEAGREGGRYEGE